MPMGSQEAKKAGLGRLGLWPQVLGEFRWEQGHPQGCRWGPLWPQRHSDTWGGAGDPTPLFYPQCRWGCHQAVDYIHCP